MNGSSGCVCHESAKLYAIDAFGYRDARSVDYAYTLAIVAERLPKGLMLYEVATQWSHFVRTRLNLLIAVDAVPPGVYAGVE